MLRNKDILIYHLFEELDIIGLSRLRQVDKFFEDIINRQMIIDKMLVWINRCWIYSFGDDVLKFKELLAQYNCIILWGIGKDPNCGLDIEILADNLSPKYFQKSTELDDFIRLHNYPIFVGHNVRHKKGTIYGTYKREHPDHHAINIKWFFNNDRRNVYLSKHNILKCKNHYTICKDTNRESLVIGDWS